MNLVVADASAIAEYLLRTPRGIRLGGILMADATDVHVPALCDIEIAEVLRRAMMRGLLAEDRAREALIDYLELPLSRHPHIALLPRILALRQNFSAYDAAYVALTESLEASVLTGDEHMARAVRATRKVVVYSPSDVPGDA